MIMISSVYQILERILVVSGLPRRLPTLAIQASALSKDIIGTGLHPLTMARGDYNDPAGETIRVNGRSYFRTC